MLQTVRDWINNIPNIPFPEYYQQYVMSIQDEIIDKDVNLASSQFTSLKDSLSVLEGLNQLTEELKEL